MTTVDPLVQRPAARAIAPPRVVFDVLLLAWRNLVKFGRNRRLMVLSTIQPVAQLVLFAFVFNGIAHVEGVSYRQFVVPAVLIQTVVLAAMRTGVAVADDLDKGMIDRFRSLPISRSAVLVGRTVSDTLRLALQTVLLVIISIAIGFQFEEGFAEACGVVAVVVVFGLAFTSFAGWVGLRTGDPETAQTALLVPVLPLVFTSSAFSPVDRLPGFMQPIARANPVTAAVDLARSLSIGGPL
ncbi:MAG TPA: ABC transporter permease, partial [Acidimicrobiales bacterium]|nr:ABC transporter permease [Acidimicrobiales bacterium]